MSNPMYKSPNMYIKHKYYRQLLWSLVYSNSIAHGDMSKLFVHGNILIFFALDSWGDLPRNFVVFHPTRPTSSWWVSDKPNLRYSKKLIKNTYWSW